MALACQQMKKHFSDRKMAGDKPGFITIYIVINVASNNDILTCVSTLILSMMYIKLV